MSKPKPWNYPCPLDINESDVEFTATDTSIRIGLKQVKGMEAFLIPLLQRAAKAFSSLQDFVYRTDVNKDVVENLILGEHSTVF